LANPKTEIYSNDLWPIDVAPGWKAQAEVIRNNAGELIVTALNIFSEGDLKNSSGLTVGILRTIKVSELIDSVIAEHDHIEEMLYVTSDYDWVEDVRKQWLEDARGEWQRTGSKSMPEVLYAKTAALYAREVFINPGAPLVSLSSKLNVAKSVLARRINKARQLGLLTRPIPNEKNAGKAGGVLTEKGKAILGLGVERKKK
jgi:hypothetical protein